MTDKIEPRPVPAASKPVLVNRVATQIASAADDNSNPTVVAVAKSDRVSLTGEALNLQQAEALPRNAGNSGATDRAESIRLAIAEGRYQFNSRTIARNLTRLEYELGK